MTETSSFACGHFFFKLKYSIHNDRPYIWSHTTLSTKQPITTTMTKIHSVQCFAVQEWTDLRSNWTHIVSMWFEHFKWLQKKKTKLFRYRNCKCISIIQFAETWSIYGGLFSILAWMQKATRVTTQTRRNQIIDVGKIKRKTFRFNTKSHLTVNSDH